MDPVHRYKNISAAVRVIGLCQPADDKPASKEKLFQRSRVRGFEFNLQGKRCTYQENTKLSRHWQISRLSLIRIQDLSSR